MPAAHTSATSNVTCRHFILEEHSLQTLRPAAQRTAVLCQFELPNAATVNGAFSENFVRNKCVSSHCSRAFMLATTQRQCCAPTPPARSSGTSRLVTVGVLCLETMRLVSWWPVLDMAGSSTGTSALPTFLLSSCERRQSQERAGVTDKAARGVSLQHSKHITAQHGTARHSTAQHGTAHRHCRTTPLHPRTHADQLLW